MKVHITNPNRKGWTLCGFVSLNRSRADHPATCRSCLKKRIAMTSRKSVAGRTKTFTYGLEPAAVPKENPYAVGGRLHWIRQA